MAEYRDPIYRQAGDVELDGYVYTTGAKIPAMYKNAKVYSPSDMHVTALVPFSLNSKEGKLTEVPLYNLALLAISTHRDKYPVVSLGSRGSKGTTRGHRMIAGSLGFTFINENPFAPLLREFASWSGNAYNALRLLPDELPKFDLLVVFKGLHATNDNAFLMIKGIEITDSGRNANINDPNIGDSYGFMAQSFTDINDLSQFNLVSIPERRQPEPPKAVLTSNVQTTNLPSKGEAFSNITSVSASGSLGMMSSECLLLGSEIHTPFTLVKVEDLNVGDKVTSWKGTEETVIAKNIIENQPIYEVVTKTGTFYCSTSHRVCIDPLNPHNFQITADLSLETVLLDIRLDPVEILSIKEAGVGTVVNIALSGPTNTYFSNGVWHHNKWKVDGNGNLLAIGSLIPITRV